YSPVRSPARRSYRTSWSTPRSWTGSAPPDCASHRSLRGFCPERLLTPLGGRRILPVTASLRRRTSCTLVAGKPRRALRFLQPCLSAGALADHFGAGPRAPFLLRSDVGSSRVPRPPLFLQASPTPAPPGP